MREDGHNSCTENGCAIEIISKLVYSQDQQNYHVHYQQLKETKLKSVIEYCDQNWHDIRSQWVEELKHDYCHYLNSTNNQLESLNQKVKSVVIKYSSVLANLFQQLMKCLHSLSIERDHCATTACIRLQIALIFEECSTKIKQINRDLLNKQYHFAEKVKVVPDNLDVKSSTVTFYSNERSIHTSQDNCDCGFLKPCHCLVGISLHYVTDLFNNPLCALLWTHEYFQKSHRIFCPYVPQVPDVTVNTINSSKCSQNSPQLRDTNENCNLAS